MEPTPKAQSSTSLTSNPKLKEDIGDSLTSKVAKTNISQRICRAKSMEVNKEVSAKKMQNQLSKLQIRDKVEKKIEKKERELASLNGYGQRRSSCELEIGVAKFVFNAGARIIAIDMPPFMQIHAVGFARKTIDGFEKFSSKSLAFALKSEFDGEYGSAWHCIVGNSFGSFVTHSVGGFLYFSIDKLYILLFKTDVKRA